MNLSLAAGLAFLWISCSAFAAEQKAIFSGPQPGEKTTAFKSLELRGTNVGHERNIIEENGGKSAALIFVHAVERSMAQLIGLLDEYGDLRKDKLRTEFVFLSADRLASQQNLPLVGQSLRLKSAMSLSVDGIEGPGNYGLNKECLLTVVIANSNKVTANFALVQPGVADVTNIVAAIAKLIGDERPPSQAELQARRAPAEPAMTRPAAAQRPMTNAAAQNIPGAAPTDARLLTLLRSFIQPTNSKEAVDKVLADVRAYVRESDELKKQTVGGWVRVIYLKYGTDYAREAGQALVDELKK